MVCYLFSALFLEIVSLLSYSILVNEIALLFFSVTIFSSVLYFCFVLLYKLFLLLFLPHCLFSSLDTTLLLLPFSHNYVCPVHIQCYYLPVGALFHQPHQVGLHV